MFKYCHTCYHPLVEFVNPDKEDICYRIDNCDISNTTKVASLMYEAKDVIKVMRNKCKNCEKGV